MRPSEERKHIVEPFASAKLEHELGTPERYPGDRSYNFELLQGITHERFEMYTWPAEVRSGMLLGDSRQRLMLVRNPYTRHGFSRAISTKWTRSSRTGVGIRSKRTL